MAYPFREIEKKWQEIWKNQHSYCVDNHQNSRPKSYILEMFPYPSGKLHMGHVRNYAIGDAIARFKKASGDEVLHPMGWDAFGLPAENAAVENKTTPKDWTIQNIKTMKEEFQALGFGFDWTRELTSCFPAYYGWEQKIFLDFYKKGIAYRTESWVNWDPVDACVLANEQVVDGRGWRSGSLVEKRKLMQWSLKITDYAQELLENLKTLTGWPEKVIKMQENWIGSSKGAVIQLDIENSSEKLDIFSTRPETLFGASFCAISPAHPLAEKLSKTNTDLALFIEDSLKTPVMEAAISLGEKNGFKTNLNIIHPFIPGKMLPLYVANFIVMDYGTGAVFGCPGHDERDYDFAKKYDLPILQVIIPNGREAENQEIPYLGDGLIIHSDFLNGMTVEQARVSITQKLEDQGKGYKKTIYRLRDWCISRQRYWGCPIPILYCVTCGDVPVPDHDLPLRLPEDICFDKTGNPLDHHPTWKHTNCPSCGGEAVRETDTLDTFFESSWYFLRFCNPHASELLDKKAVNKWMAVDWYIGGIEHAVLHLLYARFFTKALRDCGYLSFSEPFKNLLTQGMVCHQTFQNEEGQWLYPEQVTQRGGDYIMIEGGKKVVAGRSEKMSKSRKNLVDPQSIIQIYGADAARLFTLSDTPPDRDFEWNDEGIEGAWRYLNRLWRLIEKIQETPKREGKKEESLKLARKTHSLLAKITQSYENNGFNKTIAFARELTRDLEDAFLDDSVSHTQLGETAKILIQTLSPIIPHITSELWNKLGEKGSIVDVLWPTIDENLTKKQEVTIAVQLNGKMKGVLTAFPDEDQESILKRALALPNVEKERGDKPLKRYIIIPNRIVNLVV